MIIDPTASLLKFGGITLALHKIPHISYNYKYKTMMLSVRVDTSFNLSEDIRVDAG